MADRKLQDVVHDAMRVRQRGLRTEQDRVRRVRDFVRVHAMRHPREIASREMRAFQTHLAVRRHIAVAARAQAPHATRFPCRHVPDRRGRSAVDEPGMRPVCPA